MLGQAYSLLNVKAVDAKRRILTGMASTPSPDRGGDIVEPKGVKFQNPMPLLLYHDTQRPVGTVNFGKATDDGIPFEAHIPEISQPGTLADRVQEAWQSVESGLLKGVSIGYRILAGGAEFIRETGGLHLKSIEVFELSLVAVPMNADATIQSIKSFDAEHLAASGRVLASSSTPAGDSASIRVVKATSKDRVMKKTIADQIKDFEATRQAKSAERDGIMEKSAEAGQTLDAAQTEQYDTLTLEIKSIDEHLSRLRDLEAEHIKNATPVVGATPDAASRSRETTKVIQVKDAAPPEIDFARMVLCKAASFLECSKGNFISPLQIAQKRYPSAERLHHYLLAKTAVAGGTTTDANTHSALLSQAQVLEQAFLEYLRPRTIIGKFGTNGIPALKRVPFNVKIQSQTSAASAGWVGEGKAKPVTKFNTTSTTLLFTKIAAISVITDELARFSSPGAEGLVRDELARAVIERMDADFIDPAKAVSSGVNPASITNGLVAQSSAGTSAANVLTDLQNLLEPFLIANYDVSDLVLIMPNTLALVLSLMENSLGQPAFAGIGINGGTLRGIPVITSQYAASGAQYGNMVIAVSASNIALADDGVVSVDASREASIEMSDAPGQDATAGTGASMVSMFQTNSIAIRAEREINWKKLRSDAVVYMDDVNWGSIGSPY